MYDVIMTNEDNGVYDEDGDVLADGDHNVTDAVTLSASAVIVLRVTVLIVSVYSVLVSVEISSVLVVNCIYHPLTVC